MQELKNKVAVVTGAASGMGLAFANRFAAAGMHVVMSDIEEPRLDAAVAQVREHGTTVLPSITDVGDGDQMDALAEATFAEFGTAHVICNNAGVAGGLGAGFIDPANWKWVLDVNLWGVIHGHRVFVPKLIEQNEGHVINTASMAGHLPGHSAYTASKWGVVGITMGLRNALVEQAPNVGVSCLCPGWVNTAIAESDRNRPEWATPRNPDEPDEQQQMVQAFVKDQLASGMPPDEVAELVYDAVINDKFWIFTDMDMVGVLADKHDSIMENRNPQQIGLLS